MKGKTFVIDSGELFLFIYTQLGIDSQILFWPLPSLGNYTQSLKIGELPSNALFLGNFRGINSSPVVPLLVLQTARCKLLQSYQYLEISCTRCLLLHPLSVQASCASLFSPPSKSLKPDCSDPERNLKRPCSYQAACRLLACRLEPIEQWHKFQTTCINRCSIVAADSNFHGIDCKGHVECHFL